MDHVSNYRKPKDFGDEDEITKHLRDEGCAPKLESSESEQEEEYDIPVKKVKKGQSLCQYVVLNIPSAT